MSTMLRIWGISLFGGLLNVGSVLAQGSPAVWLQGNYGLFRYAGWNIALEPELRIQSNRSQGTHAWWDGRRYWYAERLQVDLKGDYRHKWKITEGVIWGTLGGGTRLAWRNLPIWTDLRPRVFADAKISFQWKRWSTMYRLRWQQQFSDFGGIAGAEPLNSYGRHKFALEYKWAKGRSLEWGEEWWVPVPGKVEGIGAWGLGNYDHQRSTITAQFRHQGQVWSIGLGWDRDRFSPEGLGTQYLLRLGHQWGPLKSFEKNAGGQ